MEPSQKENNLADFVKGVELAMRVIDKYEASRVSSLTFTKLEEAILWAQVMIGQTKAKPVEPEVKVIPEDKVEVLAVA